MTVDPACYNPYFSNLFGVITKQKVNGRELTIQRLSLCKDNNLRISCIATMTIFKITNILFLIQKPNTNKSTIR